MTDNSHRSAQRGADRSGGAADLVEAVLYLYAESPVRTGGDDDFLVDLPQQRNKATNMPVIYGSSLKGALRQHFDDRSAPTGQEGPLTKHDVITLFGSEVAGRSDGDDAAGTDDSTRDDTSTGGLMIVGEATVVALPVPTTKRIFAWVTTPMLMHDVNRARLNAGLTPLVIPTSHQVPSGEVRAAASGADAYDTSVLLGQFVGAAPHSAEVTAWAAAIAGEVFAGVSVLDFFATKFTVDLLVGGDRVGGFMVQTALPEVTRNNTRGKVTVPFDEEYFPEESVLVARLSIPSTHLDQVVTAIDRTVIRVGADRSVGKGLMWCQLVGGDQRLKDAKAAAVAGRVDGGEDDE